MNTTSHVVEETSLHIPIAEIVRETTERLEADFSKLGTKIHRYPASLRWMDNPYIVPSCVSLGPYHHGSEGLTEMEEVKHAAAHYFCKTSGHSVEDVYGKIVSIASEARGCYADAAAVARFKDAEFAVMMFLDGCYLMQYLSQDQESDLLENRMTLSTGPCMLRDIFMLENQLPWLVLEALMEFESVPVYDFVVGMAESFDVAPSNGRLSFEKLKRYKPAHLLGLLRHYLIGDMPEDTDEDMSDCTLSSSAVELAEIGIDLTPSNETWFADMSVQSGPLFGQLSLTPLFLNDVTACWLVNMVAYEACMSTTYPSDGFLISSYISLLAMLVDKEEDVHQMRAKHLVRSFLSNYEVLVFFKSLSRHLRLGHRYFLITAKLEGFKRERRRRSAVHRLVYNNIKTIVVLFSIASVLVGIFRTLVGLRQHQQ